MRKFKFAVLALALLLCGCTSDPAPTQPHVTAPVPVQTVPETVPETVEATVPAFSIPVETPCGTLYLPDDWDLPITTEMRLGDPMVLSFFAEDVKLYELTFSERPEGAVGMFTDGDAVIYVGMAVCELDGQVDMLHAMQESVNNLLDQLSLEQIPVIPTVTEPAADVSVETPYGVLHFPAKWEEYLMTQVDEDLADFFAVLPGRDPVLLFTVAFGTANGHMSGILTDEYGITTDIAIVIHEPEFVGEWSDGEKDTVYSMQEDMNDLLEALEN